MFVITHARYLLLKDKKYIRKLCIGSSFGFEIGFKYPHVTLISSVIICGFKYPHVTLISSVIICCTYLFMGPACLEKNHAVRIMLIILNCFLIYGLFLNWYREALKVLVISSCVCVYIYIYIRHVADYYVCVNRARNGLIIIIKRRSVSFQP